jgi:hypothetical protein
MIRAQSNVARERTLITNCYSAAGTVANPTTDTANQGQIGGLVGNLQNLSLVNNSLVNCYSNAFVDSTHATAGGLVGQSSGTPTVTSCY